MNQLTDTFQLRNGYKIPCVGFGTWQTPDGNIAVNAVKAAIQAGYRHIDAAAVYDNEVGVGNGIKEAGIHREELFVTSKVWNTERGYEKTKVAFEKTLHDLQLEYLDLYLIHWPASESRFSDWEELNLETWRAMTDLYKAGKIRAIGVSNFMSHHLRALMETEVAPMVNQIEFHPGQMQEETVAFCKEQGIVVEAWSPLGTGKMLTNSKLKMLAEKYEKSVAQFCIRWCIQNDVLPLPKSITQERIIENAQVWDFQISEDDMTEVNMMQYFGGSGMHPDEVRF